MYVLKPCDACNADRQLWFEQDVGGDLPEDMQIGYSGKGSGIFGSFGTPARSARPTPQVSHTPTLLPL